MPGAFTDSFNLCRVVAARCARVAVFAGVLFGVDSGVVAADRSPATTQAASNPAEPMWVNHIEPILSKHCFKCHAGEKQKGGLDLRHPQSIFAGGTDGSVVIPGRPGESPLYQRLQPGTDEHMPPDKEAQLSVEEISFVREWIAMLPTPSDHPAIIGGGNVFDQAAPSLMEMASRVKWQPPVGVEGSDAIDHLIQSRWREQHVSGNGACDDQTFVRRIYLDLAGRIPTRDEADSFVKSPESQKRPVLVDRLLAGSEYPRHMAEVLDVVLMERKGKVAEANRKSHRWMEYLQSSLAANRAWNEIVADFITARSKSPEQAGAAWFLYERKNNHQAMAEAVAPVAFGVSVACAQCHNHPLAHEIKQQQYWGLVAAFNRSANVEGSTVAALTESAIGGFVFFTNLKKETQPAVLTFPNDQTIAEKRPADGGKEKDSDANYLVAPLKDGKGRPQKAAVPKFSRRAALADAVTHDNPLLARAFVNRTWAMLLGRGLVNPVDQMDSRHPPSHPELLAWLASDFEKSGYDIKRLIRTIVLSRTYQLDSQWRGATPPPPELFARGLEKPLSAEVLYRSLLVATGRDTKNDAEIADTEALRQALIVAFPSLFEVEYNATLQQTMFLTNNPLFDAMLQPRGENLAARLVQLPTSAQRAETAFVEILGRLPDDAERARATAYLDGRSERPEAGVRQLTWALLTSAEFLLNH
ncbi:MAG: hypothetical protein JWN40_1208 [Phycisphaerales bacterium]|nr:hypothetical protein [Phycisphaerales bacterium]